MSGGKIPGSTERGGETGRRSTAKDFRSNNFSQKVHICSLGSSRGELGGVSWTPAGRLSGDSQRNEHLVSEFPLSGDLTIVSFSCVPNMSDLCCPGGASRFQCYEKKRLVVTVQPANDATAAEIAHQ